MVTTSFPRHADDGYARFVLEQAKSLIAAERSCSVVVVAPHAEGLARSELIDGVEVRRFRYLFPARLQRLGYRHEGLFETLRSSRWTLLALPFFLAGMLLALVRHSRGATVLHAQWLPTAVVAQPVAKLRRVPLFVSARGADVNAGWLRLRPLRALVARVDAILAVSDDFGARLGRTFPDTVVETLHNGVDRAGFRPARHEQAAAALDTGKVARKVLFVGGLIGRKRVADLIDALAVLRDRGSSSIPHLFVVGDGPLGPSLHDRVGILGLGAHVTFVGAVQRDEIGGWLDAADVLVLPSESEGRPNVVLEAFSAGTPVIASRVPGTTELVSDGETGLLFDVGDVAAIADALERMLRDTSMRARLAAAACGFLTTQRLTWSAHGEGLLEIYSRAAGRRPCAE